MLGRLEMKVEQCILAYSDLAESVFFFGQKKASLPFNIWGNVKARFDSTKLDKATQKTILESGISETSLFSDGNKRECRAYVSPEYITTEF